MALSCLISLTVQFAGLSLQAHVVIFVVAGVALTAPEAVAVAVGRAGLSHTNVSLLNVAAVAGAHVVNSSTVGRARLRAGNDANTGRVSGVSRHTLADTRSGEFVGGAIDDRRLGSVAVVAVELRNLVDELRRTEDVSTCQSGGNARSTDVLEPDFAHASVP